MITKEDLCQSAKYHRPAKGKTKDSDSTTRRNDSCSNRGIHDFATRSETHQYVARNDLSQQGVEEQAYERELARKEKKLAVPDETSGILTRLQMSIRADQILRLRC